MLAGCTVVAVPAVWWSSARHPLLPVAALFILCVAAGFAVAQAQSLMLATRMLSRPVGPVMLQANIFPTASG